MEVSAQSKRAHEEREKRLGLIQRQSGLHSLSCRWQNEAFFSDQQFHDTGYGWSREQQRQRPAATVRVELAPGVFYEVATEIINSVGEPAQPDLGRYEVTNNPADLWHYRTPTLRNVALTAPYMHDGGLTSLMAVVEHYNRGGVAHPEQSRLIRPLGLSIGEKQELVAFLRTLTSSNIDKLISEARYRPPDNNAR